MKQWYETLFENYGQRYDNESFTQGTIGECDFIEQEIGFNKLTKILDIGCGYGFLLYQLSQMGFNRLFGIDLAKICVTICRERFHAKKIPVYITEENIEEGSFYDNNSFDIITGTEVLEHCKNPAAVIREVVRLLKPGGTAYFSVPYLDKRQAWTHINFMYRANDDLTSLKVPENLGEYNLVNIDFLFRGLKYKVSLDNGKKFLIVELRKK